MDLRQGGGVAPLVQQPFEILSRKKAAYGSWRIAIAVPEKNLLAVGEKDKRVDTELLGDLIGIVRCLPFTGQRIPARAFRFDESQRLVMRADQHVIDESAVVTARARPVFAGSKRELLEDRALITPQPASASWASM